MTIKNEISEIERQTAIIRDATQSIIDGDIEDDILTECLEEDYEDETVRIFGSEAEFRRWVS